MNIDKLRIIVDEREKKSGIPELLKAVGMKVELKTLAIGDYIVAPETVVERKSIQDFVSSCDIDSKIGAAEQPSAES